jgi:nucleotide-binding universal stress UspA family protein
MNRVGKILVPVDFSDDAADGLKYAVSLAREAQAEIVVLHVVQKQEADAFLSLLALMEGLPALNPPAGVPVDRLLREKALDLYHLIERVVGNPGPLKIRKKVAYGETAQAIPEVAKEQSVDLVVLDIPNKSFFRRLTARLKLLIMVSRLPCPVLLKSSLSEPWPHPA